MVSARVEEQHRNCCCPHMRAAVRMYRMLAEEAVAELRRLGAQEGAENALSRAAESDAGAPALLWVDVETTGLDPSRDAILEIAAIVTDSRGREIGDPLHAVIKHDPEDVARMRATCPEAVRSMHDASGLWSLLPEGEPWREIAARLTATIAAHGPSRTLRIAGSSVRLDAAFIERYAPTAAALLHYRIVDVSSLAFVAREMGWVEGAFPKGSAHRALADIRESLAEYRWLCGLIGRHKSTSADLVAGVEMPPADADDDAEWTPARRSSGPGVGDEGITARTARPASHARGSTSTPPKVEWDAAIRELSLGWQVSETTASEAMARLERIGVNFADPQDAAADATDGMSRAERALAVKRQPPAWAGLTDRNLGRRR